MEPICDAVRGILDGHFILSRQLGAQGHYPAIDILHSVSRLTSAIATRAQNDAARKIRAALAAYRDAEDLIQLGAYVAGTNAGLDASIRLRPELVDFLRQTRTPSRPSRKRSRAWKTSPRGSTNERLSLTAPHTTHTRPFAQSISFGLPKTPRLPPHLRVSASKSLILSD